MKSELLDEINNPKRVFIRLTPASLKYGFSRTHLYGKIADGTLKSKLIQQPGTKRGIRLIEVESLEAYINSFDFEGRPEQKETARR